MASDAWTSTNILAAHKERAEWLCSMDPSLGRNVNDYVRNVLARALREDTRAVMDLLGLGPKSPLDQVDAIMERVAKESQRLQEKME